MTIDKINKLFNKRPSKRISLLVLGITILLGVFLRFYAMSKGYNFDFQSYKIVGDIVVDGGNVYNETRRYNYGPIWFTVLGLFKEIGLLFSNPDLVFRVLIVSLLTITDLAIAFVLRRRFGLLAFVLFFLNPVSIIITGYHNQFDNLAILIGLLGLLVLPKASAIKIERGHVYAALLIGLSLMTKHIFFILPVWMFIRAKSLRIKLFMLIVPLFMFLFSFLPFWKVGHEGIIEHVFLYKSFANAPFLNAILLPGFLQIINPTVFLISTLLLVGVMVRKLPALESGLWYLVVLVMFSPAIANQYLAIALPAVVALGVVFFIPYITLATFLLAGTSIEGLHSQKILNIIPDHVLPYISPDGKSGQYKLIIFCLFIGALLAAVYRYRPGWYKSAIHYVKNIVSEQMRGLRR